MVDAAARNFGRLDIVCNIAGINDLGYPLEATDDERWDKVLNIDLKAPFRICRKAVPVNCFGQPEDISKTCLFLCSDDALQINGAVIAVDGGMACC